VCAASVDKIFGVGMGAISQPLTAAQADRFRSAIGLLQAGASAQALTIAQALSAEAPLAADAQQLLGMCMADVGNAADADAAFRRALDLSPGSPVVAVNYATWLRKSNRLPEAVQVLAAAKESVQTRIQQGLAALEMRDYGFARRAFERAIELQPDAPIAWHGLGNALRAQDDLQSAAAAFRKAISLAPRQASAWVNLGAVLRLLGLVDEALASLRHAESLGSTSPELLDTINGVLHDIGRPVEALAGARRLVGQHPDYAPGYETLANLLWENGAELAPDEDPLGAFRTAAHARPDNRELQLRLARMLLSAKRAEQALAVVQGLRQRQADPVLDWFAADALGALGQGAQASALYGAAHRLLHDRPDFLNAHARHAFRVGKPELARSCAEQALRLDPHDQEAWSHLGVAWRLAGDPREHWLFDYERLIGYAEIAPPAGYADLPAFLAVLRSVLEDMHLAGREPLDQSLRNGSQTGGRLFGRSDPVLRATESALRDAVEGWLATLPDDPGHPFLSRKCRGVRFTGSWSVRLRSSGRHSNHFHNEGWLSSAFYVALPPSVRSDVSGAMREGWIQFGQPLEELGLQLPPRRMLQPRPGWLALFPSYMWHGTVPFFDPEPRLTIAFDMKPA
jgi:Flp pilus assembly protein TadD